MKKLILAIFLACLALSSAQAGKSTSDGLIALGKGEWSIAVQHFTKGCYDDKEMAACYQLGEIYEYGRGGATPYEVKKSKALSQQAYMTCCEKSRGVRKDCCRKVGK